VEKWREPHPVTQETGPSEDRATAQDDSSSSSATGEQPDFRQIAPPPLAKARTITDAQMEMGATPYGFGASSPTSSGDPQQPVQRPSHFHVAAVASERVRLRWRLPVPLGKSGGHVWFRILARDTRARCWEHLVWFDEGHAGRYSKSKPPCGVSVALSRVVGVAPGYSVRLDGSCDFQLDFTGLEVGKAYEFMVQRVNDSGYPLTPFSSPIVASIPRRPQILWVQEHRVWAMALAPILLLCVQTLSAAERFQAGHPFQLVVILLTVPLSWILARRGLYGARGASFLIWAERGNCLQALILFLVSCVQPLALPALEEIAGAGSRWDEPGTQIYSERRGLAIHVSPKRIKRMGSISDTMDAILEDEGQACSACGASSAPSGPRVSQPIAFACAALLRDVPVLVAAAVASSHLLHAAASVASAVAVLSGLWIACRSKDAKSMTFEDSVDASRNSDGVVHITWRSKHADRGSWLVCARPEMPPTQERQWQLLKVLENSESLRMRTPGEPTHECCLRGLPTDALVIEVQAVFGPGKCKLLGSASIPAVAKAARATV